MTWPAEGPDSTYDKSLGHSPCYGTADPWVNGITTALTAAGPSPTGTPPGPPTPTGTPTGSPLDSQLGSSDVAVGSLHPNLEGAIQQSQSVTFTILQTPTGIRRHAIADDGNVTETVTSTATVTATSGSSPSAAVPTSSSSALGSTGHTDPPTAAARAGLATTGSSSGTVVIAGVALVALGLAVLLLRRGIRRPQRR